MVEAITKKEYEERKKNAYKLLEWRDDKDKDAKKLRDMMARYLRKTGHVVEVKTFDYTDLGRFKLYQLTAWKVGQKICDKCKALNKFIFNHYGVYYCWDKEGRKIFEGKDNLLIPTPMWCPRENLVKKEDKK